MRTFLRRFGQTFLVGVLVVQAFEALLMLPDLLVSIGADQHPEPDPDAFGHELAAVFSESLGVPCTYDPETNQIYAVAGHPAGSELVPYADRPLQPDELVAQAVPADGGDHGAQA